MLHSWETAAAYKWLWTDASLQEYLLKQPKEERAAALENQVRQDTDDCGLGLSLADVLVQGALRRLDWQRLAEALCEEEESEDNRGDPC